MNHALWLLRSRLETAGAGKPNGAIDAVDFSSSLINGEILNTNICYGAGKGGSSGGTTTSTTTPPADVTAAYNQALSMANTAASAPLQQYQGQQVAQFNPTENQAFGTINNSQGISQPYINQAAQSMAAGQTPLWSSTQQFSPSAVNQYTSPYTQNVLNTTMAAENNQDAQQQAALQGNAISSGAWGGDRAGVASAVLSGQQDVANNATNANIENTGYNTALGEFNTEQQGQLGANEANSYLNEQAGFGQAGLGTEAQNTALTGANAQLASGQLQQQQTQSNLNVPYEQFLQQQAYPFQTAQYYANIAEGIGSGSGGTSSTTTPQPSTLSQVGGTALGLGSLGYLGYLALARGGRANGFASGGSTDTIPGQPTQGISNTPIDISVTGIPDTPAMKGGMGPPKAPQVPSAQNPISQGENEMMGVLALGAKGGMGNTPPTGANDALPSTNSIFGSNSAGSFGADTAASQAASDDSAMGLGSSGGLDSIFGNTMGSGFSFLPGQKRGGAVKGFDAGGGVTPTTAQSSITNPMQSNAQSQYQNMTAQQLQQLVMRLPAGSQQATAAKTVLQQKQMMPNVGTATTGGLGSQMAQVPSYAPQPQAVPQQQQPTMARGGRLHFDDGGNVPMPQSPDQIDPGLQAELASDPTGVAQISQAIPASALQPPPSKGGMGSKQMVASANPPPDTSPTITASTDTTPTVGSAFGSPDTGGMGAKQQSAPQQAPARREANPWLALAAAGFGMAGGTSPQAGVNIGRGALEGINNYAQQQREADTVNQASDKLMQEAEQHKDAIAQEQEEKDLQKQQIQQTGTYQTGMLANDVAKTNETIKNDAAERNKPNEVKDPFTGQLLGYSYPMTGEFKPASVPNGALGADGNMSAANTLPAPMGPDGKPIPVSSQNILRAPLGADGKPLTGDAYLATLPPNVAQYAREFGDNTTQVTANMQGRTADPAIKAAILAAPNYKPGWSSADYANNQKWLFDPNGAPKVAALDRVVPHLRMLRDLTQAMNTGDTQQVNALENKLYTSLGMDPASGNLTTASQLVGNEIVNSTIASGKGTSALGDRDEVAANINPALKKSFTLSKIDNVYMPALVSQANSADNYYQNVTGKNDFHEKTLPATRKLLWNESPSGAKQIAQAVAALPPGAVDKLRANPSLAPAFKQKYGLDPAQFLPAQTTGAP